MDYTEAKEFILGASSFGSVMGLERVRELLNRLGNPQNDLKFVHIAGTNGKGSVLAYLASILKTAGYTAGRYCSPPIKSYREVIQINDECISREAVARNISMIKPVIESMLADGLSHPTRFEMEAALAFLFFRERSCDIVLLETGIGGLEDATNVVQTTIMEIITSVSMDHMAILGDTLEEITFQKAGIIKDNTQVVSIHQDAAVEKVLASACRGHHSALTFANPEKLRITAAGIEKQVFSYQSAAGTDYESVTIPMAGSYQFNNAIIAIEAVEKLNYLGFAISMGHLRDGFSNAHWKGRFTVIHRDPLVIIDGAHNEDAARRMAESIALYFPDKRIIFLLGIFEDKEYEKIIKLTARLAYKIITVNAPSVKRLLPAKVLAAAVKGYNSNVIPSESIEDAVGMALDSADKDDVIIAFGSLSFLGAVEDAV